MNILPLYRTSIIGATFVPHHFVILNTYNRKWTFFLFSMAKTKHVKSPKCWGSNSQTFYTWVLFRPKSGFLTKKTFPKKHAAHSLSRIWSRLLGLMPCQVWQFEEEGGCPRMCLKRKNYILRQCQLGQSVS